MAAAPADRVSAAQSIQNANAAAEHVRLAFKAGRAAPPADADAHDDVSNAKKYERRLKMNRQSAAASRVRREAYTKALEAELVKMETAYKSLAVKLRALERDHGPDEDDHDDDGAPVEHHTPPKEEEDLVVDDPVEPAEPAEHVHYAPGHQLPPEQVVAEDLGAVHAFADLEPNDIDLFFSQAAQPTLDTLLADPSLLENPDVLNLPVPATLPDCFLQPPVEHDLAGNEFL